MFVEGREDMYGVDAAILMNQQVWKTTGHVGNFSDPLVDCKNANVVFVPTNWKIRKSVQTAKVNLGRKDNLI